MKTYSSLSIDVIRFESQDVITASNANVCKCVEDCFSNAGSVWAYYGCTGGCTCEATDHHYPNN